ncbi:hypothetical protein H632_c5544p0, partial [Helicosporidium sp. ATCC 50920]
RRLLARRPGLPPPRLVCPPLAPQRVRPGVPPRPARSLRLQHRPSHGARPGRRAVGGAAGLGRLASGGAHRRRGSFFDPGLRAGSHRRGPLHELLPPGPRGAHAAAPAVRAALLPAPGRRPPGLLAALGARRRRQ